MKMFLFVVALLLFASLMFYFGWIIGASMTAHQIARAILTGELSTHQQLDRIADQILSGQYVDINGHRRSEP